MEEQAQHAFYTNVRHLVEQRRDEMGRNETGLAEIALPIAAELAQAQRAKGERPKAAPPEGVGLDAIDEAINAHVPDNEENVVQRAGLRVLLYEAERRTRHGENLGAEEDHPTSLVQHIAAALVGRKQQEGAFQQEGGQNTR